MEKIFDLHNDYFTNKGLFFSPKSYFLKQNKVASGIATAIWTTKMDALSAMNRIKHAANFCQTYDGAFLAVEDLHFLTKPLLYELINLHPIYCGLTWNGENNLAAGVLSNGTLSNFGKFVMQNLEAADIFVDTAHLNETSFMAVANMSARPLLCSHTASYSICPHPRNLKDYQIKMIAGSGGLVGLCLVSNFLTSKNTSTVLDYVRHIDYCVCKFGIDHFAIGTDFNGTKHLPAGAYNYASLKKALVYQLTGLGYKPADINKLFYLNAAKFFGE